MIRHIVLLDLRTDHDVGELAKIMREVAELRLQLAGFRSFEHGPNKDYTGMSKQFSHALICSFDSEKTMRAFIMSPKHTELGQRLVNLCKQGADGMMVVDVATT
jgi:hypothetical protein